MVSSRRAAQFGLLAATIVFAASVGVLFSQGGGGASPAVQSGTVIPDPAQIKTESISLSTLTAQTPNHTDTIQH
jgi:hypothetical protein